MPKDLRGSRIYLDANVIIYAFEAGNRWHDTLRSLFRSLDRREFSAFTSELTLAEVLVKPLKEGALEAVRKYELALSEESPIDVVPVDRAVLKTSALLRAELNLKFADSIHVATARSQACTFFMSNDGRLRMPPGLTWLGLDEIETPR